MPPDMRERCETAIKRFAALLVENLRDQAETARLGGSIAVGRAAYYPGHPLGSPEAIATRYEQLARESSHE